VYEAATIYALRRNNKRVALLVLQSRNCGIVLLHAYTIASGIIGIVARF
jgi:hypothetical protein